LVINSWRAKTRGGGKEREKEREREREVRTALSSLDMGLAHGFIAVCDMGSMHGMTWRVRKKVV
jgi:hypothetical protein